jgi:drug/metabolite transporter (DMT)-like permease
MMDKSNKANFTKKELVADLQLVLCSVTLGFGYVVQRAASLDGIKPLTFNALNHLVSAMALGVVIPWLHTRKNKDDKEGDIVTEHGEKNKDIQSAISPLLPLTNKKSLPIVDNRGCLSRLGAFIFSKENQIYSYALVLSVINFSAATLGQIGITTVSASASAFITGFYVVFTPILLVFIPGTPANQKPNTKTWLAVLGSMIGLFIISGSTLNEIKLCYGESLTLIAAGFWTLHILVTEKAVDAVDPLEVTLYEMCFVATLCFIAALAFEQSEFRFQHIHDNLLAIVSMGLLQCIGFASAALGQVYAPPNHVALILATEAVFATIGGYTFLSEKFGTRECLGCMLMLLSMLITKVDDGSLHTTVKE